MKVSILALLLVSIQTADIKTCLGECVITSASWRQSQSVPALMRTCLHRSCMMSSVTPAQD